MPRWLSQLISSSGESWPGIDTVTGRASALLQLAGELPPTVVADLLGLRTKTAIAWGQLAGRPWAADPALRDLQPQ
jgi:hypothetical protein